MNKVDSVLFDTWQNEKLSVITGALRTVLEETGPIPMELFGETVKILVQTACVSFAAVMGLDDSKKIPGELSDLFNSKVISSFNSVLPDGFPYLVAAVSGSSGRSQIRISCIRKDILPGYHDIVSKNIFPLIFLQDELPDGECGIKNLSIDEISFSGGEKLPDL